MYVHMSKIATMTEFSECASVDDMLTASNTNWDVLDFPAEVAGCTDGGYRALIRPDTNTALGFVGDRYRINSHRDQLAPLDGLVRSGRLVPSTCSVWDNGALLAYQLRCPDLDVTIRGSDIVSPLLTLVFAYGFPIADTSFFADFRWYCKNQMGQVRKLIDERINHRGNNHARYGDLVGKRIGELKGELSEHYAAMRRMPEVSLSGKALYNYIGESVGCSAADINDAFIKPVEALRGKAIRIPEVLECYDKDDGGATGTVWHAYNAVTWYETHGTGRPSPARNSTALTRTRRMLLGEGSNIAANAFDLGAALTG